MCIYWLCIEITPSLFIMFGAMFAETGKRTMATTREKKTMEKKITPHTFDIKKCYRKPTVTMKSFFKIIMTKLLVA